MEDATGRPDGIVGFGRLGMDVLFISSFLQGLSYNTFRSTEALDILQREEPSLMHKNVRSGGSRILRDDSSVEEERQPAKQWPNHRRGFSASL